MSRPASGELLLGFSSQPTALGARSELAAVVEIHRSEQADGRYRMRQVDAVTVPAGATVAFSSGAYHLMFKQTRRAPRAGERAGRPPPGSARRRDATCQPPAPPLNCREEPHNV